MKKTIKHDARKMTVCAKEISYEKDFYKWTKEQSSLLKKGDYTKLDIENLREEIESLGRSDKKSLRSHIGVLLIHKLKLQYQPEGQGNSNSWKSSILNAEDQIEMLIEESPSLKKEIKGFFPKVYDISRSTASLETGLSLDKFPEECPWSFEELFPILFKSNKPKK